METRIYVRCKRCRIHLNDHFKDYKLCPLCRGRQTLEVIELTGISLTKWLPNERWDSPQRPALPFGV